VVSYLQDAVGLLNLASLAKATDLVDQSQPFCPLIANLENFSYVRKILSRQTECTVQSSACRCPTSVCVNLHIGRSRADRPAPRCLGFEGPFRGLLSEEKLFPSIVYLPLGPLSLDNWSGCAFLVVERCRRIKLVSLIQGPSTKVPWHVGGACAVLNGHFGLHASN
jgi:hypothetical protein